MWRFQSTLPRGERLVSDRSCRLYEHDFNPRSHEGSDMSTPITGVYPCYISIHAPTRGATTSTGYVRRMCNFNPRSHEGSDRCTPTGWVGSYYFNPRSHEGSDHFWNFPQKPFRDFNPRSHEGSDQRDHRFS